MSKRYRVSFDLVLDDLADHPAKWLPEAIWANLLNDGEDIECMIFEELPATPEEKSVV